MNICVFTDDYPFEGRTLYTFVKQVVDEFARKGHQCCVIAPFPFIHNKRFCKPFDRYHVEGGKDVVVVRPNYFTLSTFHIGSFSPTKFFHGRAMKKALKRIPFIPDIVYAHFWRQGLVALDYAKSIKRPLFVATGESEIKKALPPDYDTIQKQQETVGVIKKKKKNMKESISLGLTTQNKCVVIPNAVNNKLFRKMDKLSIRESLQLPKDSFIIAFVGWFNERKGIYRVVEAINGIKGTPVYSILIGGNDDVKCDNVLVKGRFAHEDIPKYLNAADAFVLPTQKEGCCNAVVEAMACGLPIISSDRDFNWDVLNESNSILVDPMSIEEIRDAIIELRDHPLRRQHLSEGALLKAEELTISKRVDRILSFIEERR